MRHVTENHSSHQSGGRAPIRMRTLSDTDQLQQPMAEQQHEHKGDRQLERKRERKTEHTQGRVSSEERDLRQYNDVRALNNGVENRYVEPNGAEKYVLTFFGNVREQVRSFLQNRTRDLGGIKWNLCLHVELQRDDGNDVVTTSPYFRSKTYITLSTNDLSESDLNESMQKMWGSLESFIREGSGFYVSKV